MNKLLKSIAFGALPILLFSSTLNATNKPQPFTTEELIAFCGGAEAGCIEVVRTYRHLSLESDQLTADNIIRFNATPNMTYNLAVKEVTDELTGRITKLENIKRIEFYALGGGFKKILQGLPQPEKLESMMISGVGANKHLGVLESFKNLETLLFGEDAGVTDEGLRHLQNLNLKKLRLTGNKAVTDEGVESIKKIRTLEYIGLQRTGLTDKGVAEIRESFPGAEVLY